MAVTFLTDTIPLVYGNQFSLFLVPSSEVSHHALETRDFLFFSCAELIIARRKGTTDSARHGMSVGVGCGREMRLQVSRSTSLQGFGTPRKLLAEIRTCRDKT